MPSYIACWPPCCGHGGGCPARVLHPCNYNDVIVPYHIGVAQGGNADSSGDGQTQIPLWGLVAPQCGAGRAFAGSFERPSGGGDANSAGSATAPAHGSAL